MKKNYLNFKKASLALSFVAMFAGITGVKAQCAPNVSISVAPALTVCAGSSFTLTANSGLTSYTWSTGSNASNIVVSPAANTLYTVSATDGAACTSSAAVTVSVINIPTITATASSPSICIGRTVSITGGGGTSYTLSNGAASGGSFAPTNTATYTVTGANACFTNTATVSITVNPLPTLTVSASSPTLCSGNTITLSVNGTASTYTWASPSVNTTTLQVTPVPSATGTVLVNSYTVTGTALGCTASAVGFVTVVTTPVIAPIASPLSVCSGGTSTLQTSGATTYTWYSAAGAISNASLVVVSPGTLAPGSAPSTITYTITKVNANCSNTQSINITLNALPNLFAVVNPPEVCATKQATLTAGGATSFSWTPVTTPTTGANVTINPSVTTTYTFTGFDGNCYNTSTITVTVSPNPTITVTSPTAVCLNNSAVLSATGATNYTWTASSGTLNLNTQQITVTPTIVTNYIVVGANIFTVASNGSTYQCVGSTSKLIYVNPLPTITLTPSNYTICLGKSATLTANAGSTNNVTYTWLNPASGGSVTTVVVTPGAPTIYTVSATTNSTSCANTKTASVYVFDQSFTVVPTSTSICQGTALGMHATGALSYIWAPNNYNTSSITITPTANLVYTVTGTSTVINTPSVLACQATYTIPITVNPNPTVTASASTTLMCRGESSKLTAGGAQTYVWAPAGVGSSSAVVVASTDAPNYVNAQTYTVTGFDANNCKATATLEVITSGCIGIQEIAGVNYGVSIYPNPNNGQFVIKSNKNISLNVMNEVGQVVRTIQADNTESHVELTDMPAGIYFVVGANEDGAVKTKIVINK